MTNAQTKAAGIKLLILDVDGILTTGALYYGSNGFEMRGFHIHDGLGVKLLQRTGVAVAVISGKQSDHVAKRLKELNIEHVYLGHEDKLPVYNTIKQALNLTDDQIAYMGDDLPDLPLLKRAGLAITVPNAPLYLQEHADHITHKKGGKGAVREACEFIMTAQQTFASVLQSYLI